MVKNWGIQLTKNTCQKKSTRHEDCGEQILQDLSVAGLIPSSFTGIHQKCRCRSCPTAGLRQIILLSPLR